MSSGDWTLNVVTVEERIDKRTVKMLAYEVEKKQFMNKSILELSPVSESTYRLFDSVLLSFYYPENPLLGECIWKGSRGAVYTRSSVPYPYDLPYTSDYGSKGIVFCAYQVLGSNPFDLVVCDHTYRNTDRERRALYSFQAIDVMKQAVMFPDPVSAIQILEKMRRYWNSVPSKDIDIDSWYPVVSRLVNRVSGCNEARHKFTKKYPNLLYLPPVVTNHDKNRRHQARSWLKTQDDKYLLVQRDFNALGYESLELRCECDGGFTQDDLPSEQEMLCYKVLESLKDALFGDFFIFDEPPKYLIIRNKTASWHGMATVIR
ncbi:MAG: hypothetical protein IJ242_01510 [Clostridia bacterium]|nr:hypothetical protein [Clostridia bacterium]